jgi:hypothetical protein
MHSLSTGVVASLMAIEAWKFPYSTELGVEGDFERHEYRVFVPACCKGGPFMIDHQITKPLLSSSASLLAAMRDWTPAHLPAEKARLSGIWLPQIEQEAAMSGLDTTMVKLKVSRSLRGR